MFRGIFAKPILHPKSPEHGQLLRFRVLLLFRAGDWANWLTGSLRYLRLIRRFAGDVSEQYLPVSLVLHQIVFFRPSSISFGYTNERKNPDCFTCIQGKRI